jgi:hypothetical protein
MAEQFPPADVPKADNVHGTPQPPSGTHTPIDTEAKIVMVGALKPSPPSEAPAPNIHK